MAGVINIYSSDNALCQGHILLKETPLLTGMRDLFKRCLSEESKSTPKNVFEC